MKDFKDYLKFIFVSASISFIVLVYIVLIAGAFHYLFNVLNIDNENLKSVIAFVISIFINWTVLYVILRKLGFRP